MEKNNETQFNILREKSEALYKSLNEVHCPYFKEKVYFNSRGLEHLKFKRKGRVRPEADQYMRLKLLYLVPEILMQSHTLQGIWETRKFERVRLHNRTDTVLKPVSYYEFIALVKRNRVKIIVKQIDGGQKFFWSIIPFWGMNKETKTRLFYEGNPEEN